MLSIVYICVCVFALFYATSQAKLFKFEHNRILISLCWCLYWFWCFPAAGTSSRGSVKDDVFLTLVGLVGWFVDWIGIDGLSVVGLHCSEY